ncbi:hypothetical protein AN161_17405 [Lysinibacillus sp. FJAT-14222]|nr:hypothetical protein AN161_17405 [Lysinibacillus sp. FJAT-14222]
MHFNRSSDFFRLKTKFVVFSFFIFIQQMSYVAKAKRQLQMSYVAKAKNNGWPKASDSPALVGCSFIKNESH